MTPLRRRMLEDMQVQNLSPHTQASYLQHVSLFARKFGKSPAALGPEDIRAYLVYLTTEKKLAAGSIHITTAALRFLYKVTLQRAWTLDAIIPAPKKPQTLPVVLSPEEVVQFLDSPPTSSLPTLRCRDAGLKMLCIVRNHFLLTHSSRGGEVAVKSRRSGHAYPRGFWPPLSRSNFAQRRNTAKSPAPNRAMSRALSAKPAVIFRDPPDAKCRASTKGSASAAPISSGIRMVGACKSRCTRINPGSRCGPCRRGLASLMA
jgi:integrase-like protein